MPVISCVCFILALISLLYLLNKLLWCSLRVRHCSKKCINTNSFNFQDNSEMGVVFLSSFSTQRRSGTERLRNTAKEDIKPAFEFSSKPPERKQLTSSLHP